MALPQINLRFIKRKAVQEGKYMSARKLEIVEPVLGQEATGQRTPDKDLLSEIKLTPRSELGAARVHTRSRRTNRKRSNIKSVEDAQDVILDQEEQIANLNDQLKASHEENRELGLKYKKLIRQMESIYVRAADAVENVD